MAIKKGSVEIELGADARDLAREFKRVGALQDDLLRKIMSMEERSQSAERAARRWLRTMKSGATSVLRVLGKVSRAIFSLKGLLLASGIGGFFYAAAKAAMRFQFQMRLVGAVAGATSADLKRLSRAAREAGRSTMFSAQEAAKAQYFLASAGMKVNEIITAQKSVIALAVAEAHDLGQTSEFVASTLSAFGLKAKDAARVVNIMSAAISNSQATMQKLINSMRYVGPVASALGYSVEETTAALMSLYNAGLTGMRAGTGLRQMLVSLINPSKEAAGVLYKMGISVKDTSGNFLPLTMIIDQFRKAIGRAKDKTELFKNLAKVVGSETLPVLLTLARSSAGAIRQLQDSITATNSAFEKSAVQSRTFYGRLKALTSAWGDLLIKIGNFIITNPVILKAIESLRSGILRWVKMLTDNAPRVKAFVSSVARAFVALARTVIMVVSRIVKALARLFGFTEESSKKWVARYTKAIAAIKNATPKGMLLSGYYMIRGMSKAEAIKHLEQLRDKNQRILDVYHQLNKAVGDMETSYKSLGTAARKAMADMAGGGGQSPWSWMSAVYQRGLRESVTAAPPSAPKAKGGRGRRGRGGVFDSRVQLDVMSSWAGRWSQGSTSLSQVRAVERTMLEMRRRAAVTEAEKQAAEIARIEYELQQKRATIVATGNEKLIAQFDEYARRIKDKMKPSMWRDMAQGAAQSMASSFQSLFFDVMEGRVIRLGDLFKRFFSGLGQAVMKIMTNRLAQGLLKMGTNWVAGLFGSGTPGGDTLGETAYAAKGAVWPGGFTPIAAFAQGGIVRRPTIGIIGEGRQDEAVVPLPGGRAIPVEMKGGSGHGDVTVNIINESGTPLDVEEIRKRFEGPDRKREILDVIVTGMHNYPPLRSAVKAV